MFSRSLLFFLRFFIFFLKVFANVLKVFGIFLKVFTAFDMLSCRDSGTGPYRFPYRAFRIPEEYPSRNTFPGRPLTESE